jgi:hypothetical protein
MSLEAGVFPSGRPNVAIAQTTLTTVNQALIVNTDGVESIDFNVLGTNAGGVITFQRTSDGVTWYPTKAKPAGASGSQMSSTATGVGSYNVNVGGSRQVQAILTTAGSGSFNVAATGTIASRHSGVTQDNPNDLRAHTSPDNLTPMGYQQIALSTTSVSTLTVPAGARIAVIQAEGGTVRWRDDGTAPTASVGMILSQNSELDYDGSLSSIQLIAVVAGALADVSYYA